LHVLLNLLSFPTLTRVFKNQFVTIFNPHDFSNFQRLVSWGAALIMFFKHPFLGVGVGNYFMNYFYNSPELFTEANMPPWIQGAHMPQVVNNIYLETLGETGILGLASFLSLLFFHLKGPLAMLRRMEDALWFALLYGLVLGFVGVLIAFLFSSAFYFPYVWSLMGLITAVERVAKKELREQLFTH